jgi:hypothetical protein
MISFADEAGLQWMATVIAAVFVAVVAFVVVVAVVAFVVVAVVAFVVVAVGAIVVDTGVVAAMVPNADAHGVEPNLPQVESVSKWTLKASPAWQPCSDCSLAAAAAAVVAVVVVVLVVVAVVGDEKHFYEMMPRN